MQRPGSVANLLSISPATLRVWSNEFAIYLSGSARQARTEVTGHAQRRYDASDIATLRRAKGLLAEGMTFAEVREHLANPPDPAVSSVSVATDETIDPTLESDQTRSLAIPEEVRLAIASMQQTIETQREALADVRAERDRLLQQVERLSQQQEPHRPQAEPAETATTVDTPAPPGEAPADDGTSLDEQRQEIAHWLRGKGRLSLARELEAGTNTPQPPAHRPWFERLAEGLGKIFGRRND